MRAFDESMGKLLLYLAHEFNELENYKCV